MQNVHSLRLFVPQGFGQAEVFSTSHLASRLGHHNDCLMVNQSDAGTYAWDDPQRTADRNFLAAISRYMP